MASNYETFFANRSFAVVGDTATKGFPGLTYQGLKRMGRTVFPVDPSTPQVDGDAAYGDLASLPQKVDAVVIEVAKEQTEGWVLQTAEAGIKEVWVHQQTDTPGALAVAAKHRINLRKGSCAVMYVTPGLTYHSIHKWIMKMVGRY